MHFASNVGVLPVYHRVSAGFCVLVLFLGLVCLCPDTACAGPAGKNAAKLYYHYLRAQVDANDGNTQAAIDEYKNAADLDPTSARIALELSAMLLQEEKVKEALSWAKKSAKLADSVSVHLLLGRIYTALEDQDAAIKEYERVIKLDPEGQASYLLLASLYMKAGKFPRAAQALEKLLEKDSTCFMAYYYLGRIYNEIKPSLENEKYYLKALDLNPHFEPALLELAALYEAQENTEKLLFILERVRSFHPENIEVLVRLGACCLRMGRIEEALGYFSEAKSVGNDSKQVRMHIGTAWLLSGRYSEAINEFKAVVAMDDNDDKAHLYLGICYAEKGNLERAVQEYKKVPKGSESYSESRIQLSNLYRRQGKIDEAITELNAVRSLLDKPDAHIALAHLYEDQENLDEAEAVLRGAMKRFPGDLDLEFQIGVLLDKRGEKEKCIAKMKKIVAADPNHAYALNYLGYTYAEMGVNLDEAERLIKRALAARPNDAYITDSLGWIYYQKGNYDDAIKELEKAEGLIIGGDPTIAEHIGDAYYKKGHFSKALENYLKTESAYTKKGDKERISAKIEETMAILGRDKDNADSKNEAERTNGDD